MATPDFAHPVERELARLYDEHGIAWEYEPHTFVLERDAEGRVSEAFTPDFFFPELDVYVECTVMRQPRTARKRRKAQKVRDRTGATVEILYQRDIFELARRWQLRRLARAAGNRGSWFECSTRWVRIHREMRESVITSVDSDFRIDEEHPRSGAVVLMLHGDADLHSATDLRARVNAAIESGASLLVIDLSRVTFIDSMALGILLDGMKRLRARGGVLRIVGPPPDVRRIFEITLLDRVFPLDATRSEALVAGGEDGSARVPRRPSSAREEGRRQR
jgi:anti-anti-sigma factor